MPDALDARPSPESFLDAARTETAGPRRGRLKIFLGASPGVGKTYAMLEEAQVRKRSGVDVLVALVETHGRAETANLLSSLETLPRAVMEYRGQRLEEMDLDALLARKPELALIDEFAHTNVPGSRHPKRWQDVMEVLDAGIDVVTTVNIQHIESLNDAVAQITGVRVQETVPDEAVERADQIELIDLPPEELIQRLKDGKVYLPQQAGRALENFFTRGKLTALREMALRTAAGRVDAEMAGLLQRDNGKGHVQGGERLLVCINEAPVAKTLVRTGKRMAERGKVPWIAATVVTPRHEMLDAEARGVTADAMRLASSLGAETVTLRAETDVAGELLRFARSRNISRIVIGRSRRRARLVQLIRGFLWKSVPERIFDAATDFEVTIITAHARARRRSLSRRRQPFSQAGQAVIEATLAVAAATMMAWPFSYWLPVASIAVVYLIAVLVVAFRCGLVGALAGSVLGFLAYNFFYTTPYFSFAVEQYEAVVGLAVFVVSSVVTGTLASRLRAQVDAMRATQARTETLYEFARKIASVTKSDDVLWAAVAHVARVLQADVLIMTPGPNGELKQVQGWPSIDENLEPRDLGAARWAFEKAESAGIGTGTLPQAQWQFVPLATAGKPFGAMGVRFKNPDMASDPESKRLILAVEDQVAVAMERTQLGEAVARAEIAAESDKLRAALLNAVSHDLRTPLVTVIGALSSLAAHGGELSAAERRELLEAAQDEARRLDRTIQNLLDMTRLGHGAVKLNRSLVDLREILGTVRGDLRRVLERHVVTIDVPAQMPLLFVDPVLIGQALANLLENAAKYSPVGTTIRLTARSEDGFAILDITDQGSGIPAADRGRVFDLFYRAARGDGGPPGTGMGLAIVKGLVEAHGGQVHIEPSDGGRGTKIVVKLPLIASSSASQS